MDRKYPLEIHSNFNGTNVQKLTVISTLQSSKIKAERLTQLSQIHNFDLNMINDEHKCYLFICSDCSDCSININMVTALIVRKYVERELNLCDYIKVGMECLPENLFDKWSKLFSNNGKVINNNTIINKLLELGFVDEIDGKFYSHME